MSECIFSRTCHSPLKIADDTTHHDHHHYDQESQDSYDRIVRYRKIVICRVGVRKLRTFISLGSVSAVAAQGWRATCVEVSSSQHYVGLTQLQTIIII